MLRRRMGFGLLALLMFGSMLTISLFHPSSANALIPNPGPADPAVLTMIDAAHIGLIGTGTVAGSPGQGSFDLSQLTGVYFNSNAVDDGSNWAPKTGQEYYRNGTNQATCPGSPDAKITLSTAQQGNMMGSIDAWLPETGTNTPGKCIEVSQIASLGFNSVPIFDLSAGGQMSTYQAYTCPSGPRGGGGGGTCYKAYGSGIGNINGTSLGENASSTLFFEQSSGTIIQAGADPAFSGHNGGGQYVYTKQATGDFTANSSPAQGNCPNLIEPITATGIYVEAKIDLFTKNATQPCGTFATTYTILVLTESPTAYFAGLNGGNPGGGGPGGGNAAPPDNCPIQNWALRWLVCPVVDIIDGAISLINGYIGNLLIIPPGDLDAAGSPGKNLFTAWSDFRDIAVSLFVIAALVMVIGESAGFDLLDAYSIRKILPRLLTGGGLITLSWILCTFAIQLDNNLINWLPDIILSPFQGLGNTASLTPGGVLGTAESAGGVALAGAGMGVAIVGLVVAVGIPAILSLILTLFLALLVAFITLTIRTMILVLWLITSPLWMACYILPTTQKGFSFGLDAGITGMLAGIAAAAVVAASQVIALLAETGHGLVPLAAPVSVILGEILIGASLRAGGGLTAAGHGMVNKGFSGAFGGVSNFRKNSAKQTRQSIPKGERFKGALGEKFNTRLMTAAQLPQALTSQGLGGFKPKGFKSRIKERLGTTIGDIEGDHAQHISKEDSDFNRWSGDDGFDKAIEFTIGKDAKYGTDRAAVIKVLKEHYFGDENHDIENDSSLSKEQKESMTATINQTADRAMRVKHKYGNSASLRMAAAEANAGTGTGIKDTELKSEREDHREQIRQFRYAKDENGKLLHEAGKHYDMVEEVGEDGLPVYLKDDAGNDIYEKDGDNNTLTDAAGNGIKATKKKMVIHDATGKMYASILGAAGHDKGVAVNMFARMRGAANQSGRMDLGSAGFGDGVGAMFGLEAVAHAAAHDTSLSREEREAKIRDATIAATEKALKSAAGGTDAAVQSGGKPYSAEALARTHFNEVKDYYARWQDAINKNLPQATQDIYYRDLVQKSAAAMNVFDSFRGRSYLNASASADSLTGNVVTDVNGKQSPNGVLSPNQEPTLAADQNVMQWFESIQHLPAWRQIRIDIGLQQQPGQQPQPGPQGGILPPGPPVIPTAPGATT